MIRFGFTITNIIHFSYPDVRETPLAVIKSICVYCGSQPGNNPQYLDAARILGQALAKADIRLVYGGGSRGIMGQVSSAALEKGGKVLGIIPKFLMPKEGEWDMEHTSLDIFVTENMHERKHKMFEESDAFIALPGGIGTLEEIVEIITWAQLGRHEKPIAFLNTGGFWDPMLELMDHMKSAGFIHTANKVRPIIIDHPEKVIEEISNH